jgi:hypothetical protein
MADYDARGVIISTFDGTVDNKFGPMDIYHNYTGTTVVSDYLMSLEETIKDWTKSAKEVSDATAILTSIKRDFVYKQLHAYANGPFFPGALWDPTKFHVVSIQQNADRVAGFDQARALFSAPSASTQPPSHASVSMIQP